MKLSLRVLTAGKQEGKLLEIKLPQFLVGRDPQCQLRPASPLISKRHCALIQRDGKAFIRDFGSTNGTFVNDERVTGEVELTNDDQLKIGPIQFTVVLEEDAAEGKTPMPKALPAAAAKTPAPATKPAVSSKTPPPATKAPLTTKTPAVGAKAPPADPKAADKSGTAPKPAAAAAKPAPAKPAGGKPSVSTPTPAPATASTRSSPGEDQMALDMLMSLDDGGSCGDGGGLSTSVPEGSTMHEIIIPPEMAAQAGGPGGSKAAPKPAKSQASGDTRSAAADILAKMTRRPRT